MVRLAHERVAYAAALLVALALWGCGGSGPEAKSPVAVAQTSNQPGQAVAQPGQQFGISDAPSSGGSAAARPKMNAAAAAAYSSGMQAFQSGDLDGASNQFTKATEADPKAYQAYYSLGVIRERLGNGSGAL